MDDYNEYDNEYNNYEEEYANNDTNEDHMNNLHLEKFQSNFKVVPSDELLQMRKEDITKAVDFVGNFDEALIVLMNYQWSLDKLMDHWYESMDVNRVKFGLDLPGKGNTIEENKACQICYSTEEDEATLIALKCKHYFCTDCWEYYLTEKSEELLTCLQSSCPSKGCNLIVPERMFYKYISSTKYINLYTKAVLKNYTENNKFMKICPGKLCSNIINSDNSYSRKEAKCSCGESFCFNCSNPSHRPCSCELYKKWEKKNNSDLESNKWIQANTKTCPHCKRSVEKMSGCNYINCVKTTGGCGKAFCYICEDDWAIHSQDHMKCNMYTEDVKK